LVGVRAHRFTGRTRADSRVARFGPTTRTRGERPPAMTQATFRMIVAEPSPSIDADRAGRPERTCVGPWAVESSTAPRRMPRLEAKEKIERPGPARSPACAPPGRPPIPNGRFALIICKRRPRPPRHSPPAREGQASRASRGWDRRRFDELFAKQDRRNNLTRVSRTPRKQPVFQ
jgi:hypothetical protein